MNERTRLSILIAFALLAVASVFLATRIRFSFDFEQFFPQGDEDLEFFRQFIDEFETDDNFLLVAVERREGVFEEHFLRQFHELTLRARELPQVEESQSLTKLSYPLKTPFGITSLPVIHLDEPGRYAADRERILADERFVYNLISPDATALVVFLKTKPSIQLRESEELIDALDRLMGEYYFETYHYLGRAYFQKELVAMQKREVMVSALVSGILVTLVMFFIFRRPWGIAIAILSVGLGMLLFLGFLGASGRELNAISALYPVLMIIVGTSDVVHIMTKYIDELRRGVNRRTAIQVTIREIGLATLLTSLTTAIGFATLLTSRVQPIRDFGINSAVGVLIAYVTVIFFTTAMLTLFRTDQLIKLGRSQAFWERSMDRAYRFTRRFPRGIALGGILLLAVCALGISRVTTNYSIISNLPSGKKITQDFRYFERQFAGFRPMEIAVFAQGDYRADDYEVVREIDRVEQFLKSQSGVRAINSISTAYKSIHRMNHGNRAEAYVMPESEAKFGQYRRLAQRMPQQDLKVLVSDDGRKARITSRILDIGADSIKAVGERIDRWIATQTDSTVVDFRRTGTGLIIDKNSEYVRESLLFGLGLAILIVSLLMALLFRNGRMLLVALIPNLFPLLLGGALLGFMGVELEAGVSIVFAVIFGIAVDDTIHFLSKFKLARNKGLGIEEALRTTFLETGKAIVLTSIILFFGFLVMLFSIHPPSVNIGLLISLTLCSALLSDLLFLPVLIRKLMK